VKHVIVIGAGLGGLAAAARLAHAGFRVTVLEKNETVGGKMNLRQNKGYTFDTGPSLLTMPFVLKELFEDVGRRMEDFLDLVPLNPICRYFWPDGSTLDAVPDRGGMQERLAQFSAQDAASFPLFLQHGRRLYDATAEPFLFQAFRSLGARDFLRNFRFLPNLLMIDAMRTHHQAVASFFEDPRIQQLFDRFATYNGSSPYYAPATLLMIPYIELVLGGWYIRGGMYQLAINLRRLAEECGAEMRTGSAVSRIVVKGNRIRGVTLESGKMETADAVISNADIEYTEQVLLGGNGPSRIRGRPSMSGFVVMLGIRNRFPHLGHHTVFFSRDYREEFAALVDRKEMPQDPTVYICNTSIVDPSHAPPDGSNLFIMANAPPLGAENNESRLAWRTRAPVYRDLILRKLSTMGLCIDEREIEVESFITPEDFARRTNAVRGSIYGLSSNTKTGAFLRPGNKSTRFRHLYFAGGSVHPGGGIPLVLLSGKLAASLVARHEGVAV
jgi:diapolycopene oxygenase